MQSEISPKDLKKELRFELATEQAWALTQTGFPKGRKFWTVDDITEKILLTSEVRYLEQGLRY